MIARYHIEDLIRQDLSGVDYRALDTETNAEVALRRFFPFGPEDGGLAAEEQEAYLPMLERVSQISHPSLRQVVGGGCDPVDAMPFIVTEWCGNPSLEQILPQGEIDITLIVEWIMQALEVSELLSHLLGEQAIWIETNAETVLISDEQEGYRASFVISPRKWLGNPEDRNLSGIVDFSQTLMGWHDRVISDRAGRGLGGWVNWLRGATPATTLQEVRDMLAAAVGAETPPPTSKLVQHAKTAPPKRNNLMPRNALPRKTAVNQSPSHKTPALVIACILLVSLACLAGWIGTHPSHTRAFFSKFSFRVTSPPDGAEQPAPSPPVDSPPPVADASEHSSSLKETIYTPDDAEALVKQKDSIVTFQGVLKGIELSSTKKMLILEFTGKTNQPSPRGKIRVADAGPDLSREALEPLIGKTLRIRGNVTLYKKSKPRADILIHNRLSIEEIP